MLRFSNKLGSLSFYRYSSIWYFKNDRKYLQLLCGIEYSKGKIFKHRLLISFFGLQMAITIYGGKK